MESSTKQLDDRLELGEIIDQRGVPQRDCRQCAKFDADEEGRGFGWCRAFEQYVKLYHPAGGWHSQCQFKNIRIARESGSQTLSPDPEEGG